MYLFGFGSLINIHSAQKSFHRVLKQEDLIPVKIKGYKKVWNSIEHIDFEDIQNVDGVFLNLQKDENSSAMGVKIKITEQELENLKLREKNYSCIKINDELITFMTTNEEKIAKKENKNAFIPSLYIDLVKSALDNYDKDFIEEYINETFKDYPFELREGIYRFSDPIQNKMAREGIKN